ncbi:hypothetical protein [Mycobacterium sp.]|uniref:hypothetical protein n=1 Tax=Mycobacterium sp. TaxID=1785 RepID=UPI002C0E6398|nr:hypothetical protein [Mycobacterium sp.]HXB85595.1 hypothetical protein [Mycobacterium sp.]
MVARGLVVDRVVGSAFSREDRVQRFDGLVRARQACGADELPKELATEQPVVIQLLVNALEHQDVWRVVPLAVSGAQP